MKLGIIGTGLIGGSLGLSLKSKQKDKYTILGYNRNSSTSQLASEKGALDNICDSVGELTESSDVIIVCTPISSYPSVAEKVRPYFDLSKVLSDVGSVKVRPTKEFLDGIGDKFLSNFIPSHPIAGKEVGGIENAEDSLFDGKVNILTPEHENSNTAIIRELWSDAGAKNIILSAEEHDRIFAKTSHLPQLLSYVLKRILYGKDQLEEFMRLADSPIEIWHDIFHYNEANIINAKKSFLKVLEIEKERFFSKSERTHFKNPSADLIFASMVARALNSIVSEDEKKFCGSGFRSFTSILGKNILQKPSSYSSYLEKNIADFIDELKNSGIPRNF